jgi:hypothetical protein
MRLRLLGLFVIATAAVSLAASALPALAATAPPAWRAEKLPGIPLLSTLNAGAAASTADAWAVGGNFNTGSPTGAPDPLIMHWNGTAWAVAATSGIASGVQLWSVVTPSSSAVWVSGDTSTSTVIYQLKGSKWAEVPLPAGMPDAGITSGPRGQVWATGVDGNTIARWTGTAWRVYRTGLSGSTNEIQTLSFASRTSGWAVGYTRASATSYQPLLPVVLRWNGTSWSKATAPALPGGATSGDLSSVADTRSAGVWATGNYELSGTDHDWLVHFNGTSWDTVPIPSVFAPDSNSIGNISVGAKSGQPQWISGNAPSQTPAYLHYSGGTWTPVPGVATKGESGFDPQVVSIPGSNATWAVGYTLWESPGGVTGQIEYSP